MDVYSLLSFDSHGPAFSAIRPKQVENTGSPVHKKPRLDAEALAQVSAPVKVSIRSINTPHQSADTQALRNILRAHAAATLTKDSYSQPTAASVYNACRTLVVAQSEGKKVYNAMKMHISDCVRDVLNQLTGNDEINWISRFVKLTGWYGQQIEKLAAPLTYIDRVYCIQNKADTIHTFAYDEFRTRIFSSSLLTTRVKKGIQDWIIFERDEQRFHPDQEIYVSLIRHLTTHGQYPSFEAHFIAQTKIYYDNESKTVYDQCRTSGDARKLLQHILTRIDMEMQRAKEMVDVILPATAIILKEIVEKSLLSAVNDDGKGVADWMAEHTVGQVGSPSNVIDTDRDLGMLRQEFELFSRVGVEKALLGSFRSYVQKRVEAIIQNTARDEHMVDDLRELKADLQQIIQQCFLVTPSTKSSTSPSAASTSSLPAPKPDSRFTQTLHVAFSAAFKTRPLVPAEQIARTLDREMRKGQQTMSSKDYKGRLEKVLELYRYSEDKDVFRTFYHRALAKRLLLGKSASDDEEKTMLKFLKDNYDPEFGTCEDMFKDLSLSRDLVDDFHSKLESDVRIVDSLSVIVLQRSAWPFSDPKDKTVTLPEDMQTAVNMFTDYYKGKHKSRILRWNHLLGTATLKGYFQSGTKELSVSLYQALVLLMFNEKDQLDCAEIEETLQMDKEELVRTLQSLALGKKRVLKKHRAGKDVRDDDVFSFNFQFTDPRAKVHINSIQAKVSPEESKRTQETIESDRRYTLDAAVVRIMKAKKELHYEKLLTETIEAVKAHFHPQVDVIKKRIESLVEQDYLERKDGVGNIFLYVA